MWGRFKDGISKFHTYLPLCFSVVKTETTGHCLGFAELQSPFVEVVFISWVKVSSIFCHVLKLRIIAKSSAYAYFLEVIAGRLQIYTLNSRGARTDPCGTRFFWRLSLLGCGTSGRQGKATVL